MDTNHVKAKTKWSELTNISDNSMFDIIHYFVKDLHVFTTNSVLRALTFVIDMSNDVELFVNTYTFDTLRRCIDVYIEIVDTHLNIRSKITIDELTDVSHDLISNCISLRQLFSTNHGTIKTLHIKEVLNIFSAANLTNLFHLYSRISDTYIDLINDVFRPIESISSDLPICIIVPSFNNIKTLTKTFDSIRCQNHSNYRLIFIDDVSTTSDLDTVLNISNQYQQNSRYLIIRQHTRQRQCAGRYIGYHMTYDDEIIVFLDGDDLFYDEHTLRIVNSYYHDSFVAMTYGSHLELIDNDPQSVLKGNELFPDEIIKQKLYRYYKFISGHLRTGYSYLFKKIHLTHLLHVDGKFLHILTDYAEMIPALEMITPDINVDSLSYLKVIDKPIYIYNYDNAVTYNTSFSRRNDSGNKFYGRYRHNATKHIGSFTPYLFGIKKNNYITKHVEPLNELMTNYQLDVLIVDDIDTDCNDGCNFSILIALFHTNQSLYLTGQIMNQTQNYKANHKLKALIIPFKQVSNEYTNLQQNYKILSKDNLSDDDMCVVGYLYLY